MNKKAISALLLSTALFTPMTFAASNFKYTAPQNYYNQGYNNYAQNLQGYALYVPAGATCSVVLSGELNSSSAVVGQTVSAILTEDFTYNGNLIASSGSTVLGTVTLAKKSGFGGRNAQLQVRFTTIRTPYNNIIPISAVIATDDSTGILKGGTAKDSSKEYLKDAVVGSGAGAVLGTALGAMSGGSVGKGAIYGTAVGGGLGLAKAVATKGEAISVPANSKINLLFDQPITLGVQ